MSNKKADQSVLPCSLISLHRGTYRKTKNTKLFHIDSEDRSDYANVQADLSLRWVQMVFVGFAVPGLITVYLYSRHEWDKYLVLEGTPGGSRIPDTWVIPPEPSSDVWASALYNR